MIWLAVLFGIAVFMVTMGALLLYLAGDAFRDYEDDPGPR